MTQTSYILLKKNV